MSLFQETSLKMCFAIGCVSLLRISFNILANLSKHGFHLLLGAQAAFDLTRSYLLNVTFRLVFDLLHQQKFLRENKNMTPYCVWQALCKSTKYCIHKNKLYNYITTTYNKRKPFKWSDDAFGIGNSLEFLHFLNDFCADRYVSNLYTERLNLPMTSYQIENSCVILKVQKQ